MCMKSIFTLIQVLFLFGLLSVPQQSEAFTLYTNDGFIDKLISLGIIAPEKADEAREAIRNAERDNGIEVAVSQYIEHGDLTYGRFEDITGLVLTVKNTSERTEQVRTLRKCDVTYAIYNDEDILLYDSSKKMACKQRELVQYALTPGETRMYEVTHKQSLYQLPKGEYRFVLELKGYGKGERVITVK